MKGLHTPGVYFDMDRVWPSKSGKYSFFSGFPIPKMCCHPGHCNSGVGVMS